MEQKHRELNHTLIKDRYSQESVGHTEVNIGSFMFIVLNGRSKYSILVSTGFAEFNLSSNPTFTLIT